MKLRRLLLVVLVVLSATQLDSCAVSCVVRSNVDHLIGCHGRTL